MMRFDSYRILLVDSDDIFVRKTMLEMIKLGGKISIAPNFEEAKNLFKMFDYDLVLASSALGHTDLLEFVKWHQSNVCSTTQFAILGTVKPDSFSNYPLIDKAQSFTDFAKDVNDLLFDFKEFENNMSDLGENNGLSCELTIDQRSFNVKPIEFNHDSLLLGLDKNLVPGSIARVKVTFHDFRHAEIFNLIGIIGKSSGEGQLFQVDSSYRDNWNAIKKCLTERQVSITNFINKVSGV